MTQSIAPILPIHPQLQRTRRLALFMGGVGLVLCLVGWIFSPHSFYPAWLCGWLLWLGISLGCMATIMLQHMTGGEWGFLVRRFGEAAANVLPLLLVLFIPVIFGARILYPWRAGNPHHDDPTVLHRAGYFQFWFWIVRYLAYFAVLFLFAFILRTTSLRHDHNPNPVLLDRLRKLSAPGMLLFFVLVSLAAVDWIMSRQPEWRSTMFGFIICMGQATSGVAFLIIVLGLFSNVSPIVERLSGDRLIDLGNLLFTCVILWAYMAFGQLLIIWLGNTQGEITWYVPRTHGPWHVLAVLLILFHFCVPFLLLLQRKFKQNIRAMIWLCVGILIMRAVDLFWTTAPGGDDPETKLPLLVALLTIAAIIGIGGLWITMFLALLGAAPLMPLGDFIPVGRRGNSIHALQTDLSTEHGTRPGTEPPALA